MSSTNGNMSRPRISPSIPKKNSPSSGSPAKQKPFVSPASPSSYKHIRAKVVTHQLNSANVSSISSDSSCSCSLSGLSLSQVSQSDARDASTNSSVASAPRGKQVAFTSPRVAAMKPVLAKKGFHTPNRVQSTPTTRESRLRTPVNGSRATAHGYRKTPGSVGVGSSGKWKSATKAAANREESCSRNYNKDLNLHSDDVLRLLTKIKSRDLPSGKHHEATLTELIQKDSKIGRKPACSSNLMGAFNGKDKESQDLKIADQSVSSVGTIEQGLEDLFFEEKLAEKLDGLGAVDVDNQSSTPQSNYITLLHQVKHENHNFISKYAAHARSIYLTDRNQLLDPNATVDAEKSINRLQNALGKLSSTTSKEFKILRQNLAYQGESIPCPFESRLEFIRNLERFDVLTHKGAKLIGAEPGGDGQVQSALLGVEKKLNEELNNLKLQLDQFESSNEKLAAQSEKTANSLKKYHSIKNL